MPLKNKPAFFSTVPLIAGILIGRNVFIDFYLLLGLLSIFLIIFFILIRYSEKNNRYILYANIFLTLLLIIFGIIKIFIDDRLFPQNHISRYLDFPQKIMIKGTALEDGKWKNNKMVFPFEVKAIYNGRDSITTEGTALCHIKPDTILEKRAGKIFKGDVLFLSGRLSEAWPVKNPGEFNYKRYLEINGIYGIINVDGFYSVRFLRNEKMNFFTNLIYKIRRYVASEVDYRMGVIEGAFLKGLLIGDRSDIPAEVEESFRNAGVLHVLAVSGLNVAFLIIILSNILHLFPLNSTVRNVIIIFILIIYMFIAGGSASIIRATIMGVIYQVGKISERKVDYINSLGFAALLILLFDSRQLFDLGFQLSFLCVFSLVAFYPPIKKTLIKYNLFQSNKLTKFIGETIFVGILLGFALFPVFSLTSGKVSVAGVIVNLIIIPATNFCMAIGFMQIFISTFFSPLVPLFSEVNQFLLWGSLKIIDLSGNSAFSFFEYYSFDIFRIILYYAVFLMIVFSIPRNLKFSIIALLLLLLNLYFWNGFPENTDPFRITFLDVGQGDAALAQINGKNILIDAGMKNDAFDTGEKVIIPFLKKCGIKKIDYFILTHFHDDHIGGAKAIINNIYVNEIIRTSYPALSEYGKELDSLTKSLKIRYINAGDAINIGGARISFLNPAKGLTFSRLSSMNANENNNSIALRIEYGNSKILMCGDIERETEERLIKKYPSFLKADIMKVAHHGSKNSSTMEFLKIVRPKYSIISLSQINTFGFPSYPTLDRLDSIGTQVLRTDKEGAIIFSSDGYRLQRIFWR